MTDGGLRRFKSPEARRDAIDSVRAGQRRLKVRFVRPTTPPDAVHVTKRSNGAQLSRLARRAQLANMIRHHIKTAHKDQTMAPAHLGAVIYGDAEMLEFCEICSEPYLPRRIGK